MESTPYKQGTEDPGRLPCPGAPRVQLSLSGGEDFAGCPIRFLPHLEFFQKIYLNVSRDGTSYFPHSQLHLWTVFTLFTPKLLPNSFLLCFGDYRVMLPALLQEIFHYLKVANMPP